MKKITLLLTICIALIVLSCKSDDDSVTINDLQVTTDLILGKWYFVEYVVNGSQIPYDDHEDCGKDYLEFRENGTFWQIDVWGCDEDAEQIGVYSISNGKLIINGEEVNVLELNSNKLSIQTEEDFNEDGNIDDVILNLDR